MKEEKIVAILKKEIASLKRNVTKEQLLYLEKAFLNYQSNYAFDYNTFAEAFVVKYFFINFYKTLAVLKNKPIELKYQIVDIGAGSGAATVAYLVWLNTQLKAKVLVKVTLIDKSKKHLKLAKKLIILIKKELKNITLDITLIAQEASTIKSTTSGDMIFLSHVLTENKKKYKKLIEKAVTFANNNASFFIIERDYDPLWNELKNFLATYYIPYQIGTATIANHYAKNIPDRWKQTKYAQLFIPQNKKLVTAVKKYFHSWRHQSVNEIVSLFAKDGIYHDKPLEDPLQGSEQIKKYWVNKVLIQKNIKLKIDNTFYLAEKACVEWEASFQVRNEYVMVKGIFIMRIQKKKVVSFIEYYNSKKS